MPRHGRHMAKHDWLVVYMLASGRGEQPYVELSFFDEHDRPSGIPSTDNTEKSFLKKEMAENLSLEAKDILRLILTAPAEVVKELTTPIHACFSKRKIKAFLLRNGWKTSKVDKAFVEIREFVREIEKLN